MNLIIYKGDFEKSIQIFRRKFVEEIEIQLIYLIELSFILMLQIVYI